MKRILVLHTGGTITMQMHDKQRFEKHSTPFFNLDIFNRRLSLLQKIARIESRTLYLLDSSNISPQHWDTLAGAIAESYPDYDGFVILHGTDTMAYTASALSYSLENLNKPVVFTGSQVPLEHHRTDALRNLVNAVELAALSVPEVCICFNDKVYRGNRSTKISIGAFDAFTSPNYPLLAEFGLRLQIHASYRPETGRLRAHTGFSRKIQLLTLFPGMDYAPFIPADTRKIRALVLEAYGSGNLPAPPEHDLLDRLEPFIASGGVVVITSQALYDEVDLGKYEGGRRARGIGAISAGDMTREACLTKLMYLFKHYDDPGKIREKFLENIAGERSR